MHSRSRKTEGDEADAVEAEANALAARVESGALSRGVLELLAGVDDRAAQRALGRLPLVLTYVPPYDIELDDDVSPHTEAWLRWASRLEPFGRALSVRVALAGADVARTALAGEEPGARSELVGLHTGPFGVLVITRELAKSIAPFSTLAARTCDAVRRWLDDPSAAALHAVATQWPDALSTRSRAELLTQLVEVEPAAVWAVRWAVVAVTDPATPASLAAGAALGEAQTAVRERGRVSAAVRSVLRSAFLGA